MGLAPLTLVALHVSCWRPAAPARVGPGSPPAVLLQEEERDDQEHRAHFEEWCRTESVGQAALRTELQKARGQAASPEGSAVLLDTLSHQAAGLASLVERRRAEFSRLVERRSRASMALQHLEKQVEALSGTKGQLEAASRPTAGANGGTVLLQEQVRARGSLKVVSELLQKAQSRRQQVASEVAKEPAELQREVDALEQQFQANTSGLAALRATRKAALRRQELLLDALESEDAFLADLDSICRLGQEVYGRMEAEFPKILHGVVQLIDQCEEELRTSTTPTTTPPTTTAPPLATQAAGSDALAAPATPVAIAAAAADPPPAAQPPPAVPAAAAAPAGDEPAVESLAQIPPPTPRPRRPSAPGAPPAAVSTAALRAPRPQRTPTTAARAPPAAEDGGEAQDLDLASDTPVAPPAPRKKAARTTSVVAEEAELDPANDPPIPPAPRKKAARASPAAAAAEEEAELDPVNDPPPAPRKKAARASPAAAAVEEAELDPASDPPTPPAPRKKAARPVAAVAAAAEEAEMDPTNDPPTQPEPRKKASPRQRGLAEARRVEEQFDEDDDSGDADAPAAGPARGAEGPGGHLRADGDRLARLSAERGARAPKGAAAEDADADSAEAEDEEAAPPAHHKKRAAQAAAAAPPADPLADDDDAPAAPEPRPSRKRHRAAEAAQKPVLDQQDSVDEDADAAQDSVAPPPPRRRGRRPGPEENAATATASQDEDAADEEPPPPRRRRRRRPDAGQQAAEAAAAEEPPEPTADAAAADAEPAPKGMPTSLRGGWKAMMKGKKKPRKHDFHDQTSGIMDLVQTPTTYAAWHPEHSDTSLAVSAKNELLAAEKAFDTSDSGDGGGASPESFLQLARSSEALEGSDDADFGRSAPETFLPSLLTRARLVTFAGAFDDEDIEDDQDDGTSRESFLQLADGREARSRLNALTRALDGADDDDDDDGATPESFLQLAASPEVVLPPPPALPPMPTSLIEEPSALLTVPALAPLLPAAPAAPADAAAGPISEKAEAVGAASLLLEQYAHSLGSGSLLQLARARPSLAGLKALWKRLSATDSTTSAGHDAETSTWCRDFERQTEATARAAARARGQAKTGLAAANAERKALEQEAAVRKHLLDELRQGSKSLNALLGSVKRRGASTAALFKAIQDQVQKLLAQNAGDDDADVSAKVAAAQEAIGRAEGLSTSGDAEVQDIISAALARRAEVERAAQAGAAQLQAHMRSAERRRAELRRAAAPPASDAEGGTSALKEHYGQMCRWTLDEMQARRLHEESEKDAIRAALAVLGAR